MDKILVIRLSSLGDVVLTTAVLPNLRAQYPGARISYLTKSAYAPLLERNPNIDEVIAFNPATDDFRDIVRRARGERFDLIVDLHSNTRSWFLRAVAGPKSVVTVDKVRVARWIQVVLKRTPASLRRSVRERNLAALQDAGIVVASIETQLFPIDAAAVVEKFGLPRNAWFVGVAPGAKHNTKCWPPERFAEACDRMGAFPNAHVVILGDATDAARADQVAARLKVPHTNLAGKTTLAELVALTSRLSFLLTNDSGILHIGEALKVPLVALFGPTVRAFGFAPYRSTSRVVEVVNLPCRPCTLHGDVACPLGHHRCMNDIEVSAVAFAASSLFPNASGAVSPESAGQSAGCCGGGS